MPTEQLLYQIHKISHRKFSIKKIVLKNVVIFTGVCLPELLQSNNKLITDLRNLQYTGKMELKTI